MPKKYKLVIPEMIKSCDAHLKVNVQESNGFEIVKITERKEDYVWVLLYGDCGSVLIPRNWLQEIKEPMTFDEIITECRGEDGKPYSAILNECMQMAVENEQLKHEPKQSLLDAYQEWVPNKGLFGSKELFELGWRACEKNRGYNG